MLTKHQQQSVNSELGLAYAREHWAEDWRSELTRRCPVCGVKFPAFNYTGRPRKYHNDACKQKAWRLRKKDHQTSTG
jgi:hypothetical protein